MTCSENCDYDFGCTVPFMVTIPNYEYIPWLYSHCWANKQLAPPHNRHWRPRHLFFGALPCLSAEWETQIDAGPQVSCEKTSRCTTHAWGCEEGHLCWILDSHGFFINQLPVCMFDVVHVVLAPAMASPCLPHQNLSVNSCANFLWGERWQTRSNSYTLGVRCKLQLLFQWFFP